MNLHKPNNPPIYSLGRAALAWLGCAGLFLAGCSGTEKKNDDPLFGVKPPTVNPVPATSGAPGSQTRATAPPIPGNTSATSTAALASLPGGRALSIKDQPTDPLGAPNKVSVAPNVQPIPRDTPTAPGLLATGSWTTTTPAYLPSSSSAQTNPPIGAATPGGNFVDPQFALLQARGIIDKKLENVPEGVRLTALGGNPERIYEATARDYPAAVQAILRQLDQAR